MVTVEAPADRSKKICDDLPPIAGASQRELHPARPPSRWLLHDVTAGGHRIAVPIGFHPFCFCLSGDGRYSFDAIGNRDGRVTIDGDRLTFESSKLTDEGRSPAVRVLTDVWLRLMPSSPRWAMDGLRLVLTGDDVRMSFLPDPPR